MSSGTGTGPESPSSGPSGVPCQSEPPVGTRPSCAHSRLVNARCSSSWSGRKHSTSPQAVTGQPRDEALERGVAQAQRVRMGEHRRAAARCDELDRVLGPERAGVDVGRLAVGEQAVEGLLHARHVPGVDQRSGDVRPAHPPSRAARDVLPLDGVAELVRAGPRCAGCGRRDSRRSRGCAWPAARRPRRAGRRAGAWSPRAAAPTARCPARSAGPAALPPPPPRPVRRACRDRSARACAGPARARARPARSA